jgi:site-specific recombinase XerD
MAKKNTALLRDHIDPFLADVERRRDLRPNTIRSYQSDLMLAARILTMPLAAIADADLDAVLQPLHPATRRRRASALNQFFTWAVREQVCLTNPLTGYAVPRVERRLPRPIRTRSDRKVLDGPSKPLRNPFR